MNYYYAGGIVAVLLVLFAGYKNVFGSRFKRMSVDFMTKAQYSRLGRNALADSIAKFRKGTMDEKMVLVIANLIEKVPGLSTLYTIFPKKVVVNFLYSKEQAMFDLCESALKGYKKYPIPGSEITAELIDLEPRELNLDQLDKIQETTDALRKVLPTLEKLNPILDSLPTVIEMSRLLSKDNSKNNVVKDNVGEKQLVGKISTDNMAITKDPNDVNSVHVVTEKNGILEHDLKLAEDKLPEYLTVKKAEENKEEE